MARTTNLLCLLASFQVGCVSCSSRNVAAVPDSASFADAGFEASPSVIDASADGADAAISCLSPFQTTSACEHGLVAKNCNANYCSISPGCFVMGSPECQHGRGGNSEPEVQVTLTHRFEVAQTETRRSDWSALGFTLPPTVGGANDCESPTCPVGV
jgi:hypothetical protein